MVTRIGFGLTLLLVLMIDWLEFHDVLEAKTVPEYLTGLVSIPVLLILAALVVGVVRLSRSPN
jgi:hypothetical protein